MTKEWAADEKQSIKQNSPEVQEPVKGPPKGPQGDAAHVARLQQLVGNRAVQRLLAQRSADGSFELDDDTVDRIDRARGGGQPLDATLQTQMGDSLDHDFSGVQVHSSPESDDLNQQLSAKAFTTGQDIFFRQGDYDPSSSAGRELIAHELTHVVQQSSGLMGGGNRMTVRPAGDIYEREADAVARQASSLSSEAADPATAGEVAQRQAPEEEELQAKAAQRQMPEEEELQAKAVQRQMPEEEELQAKALQRQDEIPEEEL